MAGNTDHNASTTGRMDGPGGGNGEPAHTGSGGEPAHTGGLGGPGGNGGPAHTGGGGATPITIVVNNREYKVDKPSLTGAELRGLAGEPADRMVMWVKTGEDDEAIPDDRSVDLVTGIKFRIVNAGTFG